ncbi:MAG: dinitrogenase iron-molybdenum cofactor biosynthesis protein [Clostridiaceae bacterium]|jgi:predicted Fe-Mo cluster-binding NifX family protein|nr:dinitrogenase iron-molybdenum cofactor biosynthesis protein [Clostridiaceae bacterium]HZJ90997.1 NifB/NifX family molybdenum-iron cluster-binding protein [Oscillospiraceae bacterium]
MKIAIPVDRKSRDSDVCVSFGRAPYFLLYDSDSEQGQFLLNSAAESAGGAGIKAAQIIVDSGAEVLLTPRCGKNAADVIIAAEIPIYKTKHKTVTENVDAFLAGELDQLDEIHAGFHGA